MPKYYGYKVYGYYLYFTSHCIVEAMHAHAGDREIVGIRDFIKLHYQDMYLRWSEFSDQGFYRG